MIMFTGIIEATSPIQSIIQHSGTKYVVLSRPQLFDDIKIGSSIACNGICLTVLQLDDLNFTTQISQESLVKSNVATWKNGDLINLERALRLGDRLDGHWVMGHIDRTVKFLRKEQRGGSSYYHFELAQEDRQLIIPQGSIAINGISLTIAGLSTREFYVTLIEHTIEHSNLPLLRAGNLVNLEYDALGKYVLRSKL